MEDKKKNEEIKAEKAVDTNLDESKEMNAQTEPHEEAKKILKDAGLELTDAELDQVAGGLPRKITRV